MYKLVNKYNRVSRRFVYILIVKYKRNENIFSKILGK